MPQPPTDWSEAKTLEDYVFELFENQATESKEFKALLRVFGREKMNDLWKKFCSMKQQLK